MNKSHALIVVDVQNEYFTGCMPITYPENSFDNIKKAIRAAKQHDLPVIFVKHLCASPDATSFRLGAFEQELHADLIELGADHIVTKEMASSFHNTDLKEYLDSHGITTVTVAGYMTQMCCDTTARYAAHLGYKVNFLSDGTGTLDFTNEQGHVSAKDLHTATLITQANFFSHVLTTDAWINEL